MRCIAAVGLLGGLLLMGDSTPASAQSVTDAPAFLSSGAAGIRLAARSSGRLQALDTWLSDVTHMSREHPGSARMEPASAEPLPARKEYPQQAASAGCRISTVALRGPLPPLRIDAWLLEEEGMHEVRTVRLEVF